VTSVELPREPTVERTGVRPGALLRRAVTVLGDHEVAAFLLVGGAGYVVDVVTFNLVGFAGPLASLHPVVARTVAVLAAMTVTYLGNRSLTWRRCTGERRRREISLFVLFNAIGFAISAAMLVLSHDVLGLTSRLADNVSANVIGVGLGTVFRFVTYRSFVFVDRRP
jgi:putative flippase GtrA